MYRYFITIEYCKVQVCQCDHNDLSILKLNRYNYEQIIFKCMSKHSAFPQNEEKYSNDLPTVNNLNDSWTSLRAH